MELLLELMSKAANLAYDVNDLMKYVDENMAVSFLDAAENGRDISKFDLKKKELVELYKKRSMSFALNDRIMLMLVELSREEKEAIYEKLTDLINYNKKQYASYFNEYQQVVDVITNPSFSFEGHEEYKELIIVLKDGYNRCQSIIKYYENIQAYLKTFVRGK